MKIIRYLDPEGRTRLGALQPDGSACEIEGDLFGDFRPTPARANVKKILAPVAPVAILGVGLNYRKHAEEAKAPIPEHPVLFMKAVSAIQNPSDPIVLPRRLRSNEVDYEGELAVVIGKRCKNVGRERALEYVLGYTCANDVSARDWQRMGGGGQGSPGKPCETLAAMGPSPDCRDEVPGPRSV